MDFNAILDTVMNKLVDLITKIDVKDILKKNIQRIIIDREALLCGFYMHLDQLYLLVLHQF